MFGWLTITHDLNCLRYRLYKSAPGTQVSMFETSSKSALMLYLDMAGLVLNFSKSRRMFQKSYFVGERDQSTGCIQADEAKEQDD